MALKSQRLWASECKITLLFNAMLHLLWHVWRQALKKTVKEQIIEAVKEIQKASEVLLDQVEARFRMLPVFGACSLFAADFDPAKVSNTVIREKLTILADHLATDVSTLEQEFDEIKTHVAQAKAEGLRTTETIWSLVLNDLQAMDKRIYMLEIIELWFALQVQNGTLERNFSHKKCLELSLKGGWTTEGMDDRLRIRLCGKHPRELITPTSIGTMYYHDDLVLVAKSSEPKVGNTPPSRKRTITECFGQAPRQQRSDLGGKHKRPTASSTHATEEITVEDAKEDNHIFLIQP